MRTSYFVIHSVIANHCSGRRAACTLSGSSQPARLPLQKDLAYNIFELTHDVRIGAETPTGLNWPKPTSMD